MENKIGILGCGWLGFPLAERLINDGFSVSGTTTSEEKLKQLSQAGIDAHHLIVTENGILGESKKFFQSINTLILNIPPGLRGTDPENYVAKIAHTLAQVTDSTIQHVIFISTTAVYKDTTPITTYTTENTPVVFNEKSRQLIVVEELVQQLAIKTQIIRPGGLVGGDRHPIKYLAGRKNMPNPDAPVNMTNRNDLIQCIVDCIRGSQESEVLHCISLNTLSRKQYYTQAAQERKLVAPQFVDTDISVGKRVV